MATARGRGTANNIENKARSAAYSPGLTLLARFGCAARGLVYLIVGLLSAQVALGIGGTTTDRKGALQAVYEQPFGKVLLAIVTVGLLGYALWKLIEAGLDTGGKGTKPKGIATRIGYAVIAISYGSLAFAALQLVIGKGNGGKSSDQSAQDWTATFLKQPFGPFLVIVAGLVVIGYGVYQFYKAYKADFYKKFDTSQMSAGMQKWAENFGRFGLAARGVVFCIIGLFLAIAALQHNPQQAKGLGGALQELSQQTYGQILLGVVALGFIAYAIFSFIEARYWQVGKNM